MKLLIKGLWIISSNKVGISEKKDIAGEFPKCIYLALWAPHLEHNLVLLYLWKGKTLYSQYLQN